MRITELTATTEAGLTDYLAIDNTTMGTRKILASDLTPTGAVSYSQDQTSIIDSTDAARARANIDAASTSHVSTHLIGGSDALPAASTSATGLVQLYDGTDSTSTTLAATANAVRLAYNHGGGGTGIGSNILDNWYFLNPVNQRGQSTYSVAGYTIDRWRLSRVDMTANVLSSGLQVSTPSGYDGKIIQRFESGVYRGLSLTASVLFSDGTLLTGSATSPTADDISVPFTSGYPEITFSTASGYDALEIKFKNNTSKTMVAAKLEIGSSQTLCFDDNGTWKLTEIPNYQDQVTRCYRYLYVRKNSGNYCPFAIGIAESASFAHVFAILPTDMRDVPTITYSGTLYVWNPNNNQTLSNVGTNFFMCGNYIRFNANSSGLTANTTVIVRNTTSNASMTFSAEL